MAIRVLIIDDAASMRELYTRILGQSEEVAVIGTAADAIQGREMVLRLQPEVILLDLEMPQVDGITFLKQLMRYQPIPTLIISAATTGNDAKAFEALRAGAIDVIPKLQAADKLIDFAPMLIQKIIDASKTRPRRIEFATSAMEDLHALEPKPSKLVIAVGASTGGTSAVEYIITHLNRNMPAVIIAIHLPARFTAQFAKRLDSVLPIKVKEAEQNELLCEGVAYITPGAQHIRLSKSRRGFIVKLTERTEEDHYSPDIDCLFESVARYVGERALGIILTGMGDNGARGLLKMREAGAMTIAEDESTAVVFGMPKAAKAIGAAWRVLPLHNMRSAIIDFCSLNQPAEDWMNSPENQN
ncbi:MAG: chemotaxis-specific protein-glutamate methyltransferase CheB [Gammaproteobacteria bacterium]|nr:chemotaxis-specific protein-glutamate methyltransferase CheB [Gammaproteobacteria bacterium]